MTPTLVRVTLDGALAHPHAIPNDLLTVLQSPVYDLKTDFESAVITFPTLFLVIAFQILEKGSGTTRLNAYPNSALLFPTLRTVHTSRKLIHQQHDLALP